MDFSKVENQADIYLAEIQIDSKYQHGDCTWSGDPTVPGNQSQGIGTDIIKNIINQAELKQKRLWLKVIKGNPAERLYQKLRFTIFEESITHKKMQK